MQVIVLSTFFEVDAILGSMYQILLSFLKMGNVVYGSFVVEAVFTI